MSACALERSSPLAGPPAALARSGFALQGQSWVRDDLRCRHSGRWIVLEKLTEPALRVDDLGQPGLWKTVTEQGQSRRVFELPDAILTLNSGEFFEGEEDVFAGCLAWALQTAQGKVPDHWRAETRESLEAWLPKNRLTVLTSASVRQGELVGLPHRLALRFPIVPALPERLPAHRLVHVRTVLRDAQDAWSLVRLGMSGEPPSSLVAEIDLTGAPAGALEILISTSLDALHNVLGRIVETTEILTDAEVASVALDSAAFPTTNKKDP